MIGEEKVNNDSSDSDYDTQDSEKSKTTPDLNIPENDEKQTCNFLKIVVFLIMISVFFS